MFISPVTDVEIKKLEEHYIDSINKPERHRPWKKSEYTRLEAANLCSKCMSFFESKDWIYFPELDLFRRK